MSDRLTVSVVVSHINSARTLRRCLTAILRQDYPAVKVVVVDAGSTDGSIEIVQSMLADGRVLLVMAPGCTESEGQMHGVHLLASDVVMFTNSDCYVPVDWVSRHVEWIRKGFDVVGGRCLWAGDAYTFTWNMAIPKAVLDVQIAGLGLGFSNAAVRRDYLLSCGGLKKMAAHQDTEFAFQTLKDGGKMVMDFRIEVVHDHPFKSVRGSFWRSYGYARNHMIVARVVFGHPIWWELSRVSLPVLYSAVNLVREVPGVNGVMAWKEYRAKAGAWGMEAPSLPRFLWVRWFGWLLGHLAGVPVGLLKPSVTLASVTNLHTQRIGGKA